MKAFSWGGLALLGAVTALVAAVAWAPASMVEAVLHARAAARSPGAASVTLRDTTGTIWRGESVAVVSGPDGRPLTLPVRWSWTPRGLPALAWDVAIQGPVQGTLRVAAGWRGVTLSQAELTVAVETLARFDRRLALLRPAGSIALRTDEEGVRIAYGASPSLTGRARLTIGNIALRSIGPSAFGSYEVALACQGARIDYNIDRASGPLRLDGGGYVQWDGSAGARREFVYRGSAALGRGAPGWLLGALLAAGRATADGRVMLTYRTQW